MNEKIYLENIITPLLSIPNDIEINQTIDERGVLLTLTVASADMGRIIGKLGATANAIRLLMRQYGAATQKHISVKINDPVGSVPYRRPEAYASRDREMLENN